MNKKNVVIFCLFFCLCSPPPEDGEITVVELDSVTTIDQEKIDRFKDHFSEELEDGVISEEEFKDNIKSHHRKGHHKSKGNK